MPSLSRGDTEKKENMDSNVSAPPAKKRKFFSASDVEDNDLFMRPAFDDIPDVAMQSPPEQTVSESILPQSDRQANKRSSPSQVSRSNHSRYVGDIVVNGWSLVKGSNQVHAGDAIRLDRSKRPPPPAAKPSKKKGAIDKGSQSRLSIASFATSSKGQKENNIVRFYNASSDREIGRLPLDTAKFISRLLDAQLCEFEGSVVYAAEKLNTGDEIIISIRCYLNMSAFNNTAVAKADGFANSLDDASETKAEKELSDRKASLCLLLQSVNLNPTRSNSMLQEHKESGNLESDGMKAQFDAVKKEGDEEEEAELEEDELNIIYEKAQTNDANMDVMDPPNTFALTLRNYQRQALRWMVSKEQQNLSARRSASLHPLWEEYIFPQDPSGGAENDTVDFFYFNPYSGELTLEMPTANDITKGGILADEMGLGKTIMVASLIHSNRLAQSHIPKEVSKSLLTTRARGDSPTTLVVVPMSLIAQWKDEILRSGKEKTLRVELYYGSDKRNIEMTCTSPSAPDVLITSYGTVLSDFTHWAGADGTGTQKPPTGLFAVDFYRCILDEAHHIKGRLTKTARACYALKAQLRWCLTGTPIQNKLEDLFSLVHFLRVEPWGNFSFWKSFITVPFERKDMRALDVVQTVLEPLILRRTKNMKDSDGNPIVSLPPKHIEIVELDFSEEERQIYRSLYTRAKMRFQSYVGAGTVLRNFTQIFAILMSLRQACCHPLLVLKKMQIAGDQQIATEDERWQQSLLEDADINVEDLIARFSGATQGDQEGNPEYSLNTLKKLMDGGNDTEDQDETAKECPLCFELIEEGVLLPCMHMACKDCVVQYLQKLETEGELGRCPICRHEPVLEADLIDIIKERPAGNPMQRKISGSGSEGGVSEPNSDDKNGSDDISHSPGPTVIKLRRNLPFRTSTKLHALLIELKAIRKKDPSAKAVVFSQFTSFLDLVQLVIDRQPGMQTLRLDGSMSQVSRADVLERFSSEKSDKTSVMCISLRAGGVGLNLTAANYVFMLDCWWNYAAEAQAVDRVHRIGQTKEVFVKRFVVSNTIEIKMLKIQQRKNALVMGTLGANKDEAAKQRLDDLKELFE